MALQIIVEGTGEEIAEFAHRHPTSRFKLVSLDSAAEAMPKTSGPVADAWSEVMEFIHSYKGKLPVLPQDATATNALYD